MKRYLVSACPILITLVLTLAVSNSTALGAARSSDTLLIVPARPGILQLAFDLAKMRAVTLVSFRGKADTQTPLLHVWKGTDWQYISFDDFCSLQFVGKAPATAIVIGDDQTVPGTLLQGMAWPCRIERLPSMNAADLINGLAPYFKFSSREWKRLAASYGLKLEDLNAPKRSFNPYTIPRSKLPLETRDFKREKGDAPPAVMIEEN